MVREETADLRRSRILDWMRAHRSPVHGDQLARRFQVSRQCLVQDVAILRAGGQEILGTPRGYRFVILAIESRSGAHKGAFGESDK